MEPVSAKTQKKIAEQHLARHKKPVRNKSKLLLVILAVSILVIIFWRLVVLLGWGSGLMVFGMMLVGYSFGRSLLYLARGWAAKRSS